MCDGRTAARFSSGKMASSSGSWVSVVAGKKRAQGSGKAMERRARRDYPTDYDFGRGFARVEGETPVIKLAEDIIKALISYMGRLEPQEEEQSKTRLKQALGELDKAINGLYKNGKSKRRH